MKGGAGIMNIFKRIKALEKKVWKLEDDTNIITFEYGRINLKKFARIVSAEISKIKRLDERISRLEELADKIKNL